MESMESIETYAADEAAELDDREFFSILYPTRSNWMSIATPNRIVRGRNYSYPLKFDPLFLQEHVSECSSQDY